MMPPEISPRIISTFFPATEPLLSTRFDEATSTLWIALQSRFRRTHHLAADVLQRLREVLDQVAESELRWHGIGSELPLHYAVLRSEHPACFSLGGDLGHLLECARKHDGGALRRYAMQSMDTLYLWATAWNRGVTTISLVQGRALGAGFEAALAADYVIAEEGAEFGFPEILFGLFPCNGAMSLLGRRIGLAAAERMIRSGRMYSATELLEMGVVDQVCPAARGDIAVREFIEEHAKRRNARLAVQRARARMQPLDYAELAAVVADWVDVALQLGEDELRLLETLIRMQRTDFAH